jgi:aspartyl-tRNA synthetase
MVSGCDRYYQIARCLRDEDLRQDRQPEHTQVDLEMSFVHQDDVLQLVEGLYKHIVKKVLNRELPDFPRFSYEESMNRFGSDKPDLRFGLELIDVTAIAKKSDFEVFKKAEAVKCLNPQKEFSRKHIDELTNLAGAHGAKGLAYFKVTDKGLEGSIAKFFSDDVRKKLLRKTGAKPGSMLFFVADKEKTVHAALGELRNELGRRLEMIDQEELKFCWVIDYPLFEEVDGKWVPCHHIFSMPKAESMKHIKKEPGKVLAYLHDLVLNGTELGSGSMRITDPDVQEKVLKVIGLGHDEAYRKFGFLMDAFRYGTPPHGGMGLGLDRTVALLCGLTDIREIIAFPKNKNAECPMDGSPSDVPADQLKELHIKTDVVKKKS